MDFCRRAFRQRTASATAFLIWSLTATSGASASPVTPAVGFESVSAVTVNGRRGYSVSYHYEFSQPFVYISGLGRAPSRGAFHYLTFDRTLQFRTREGGDILAELPIVETLAVASKLPADVVPSEQEFPPAFKAFQVLTSESVPLRADAILGKYFNYQPRSDGPKTFVVTTFTPLRLGKDLSDHGVQAQVALLLSFPYDAGRGIQEIHVQSLVQEGRLRSDDFRPTSNQDITKAADALVADILRDISSPKELNP